MTSPPTVLLSGAVLDAAEFVSVEGEVYRHFFRARRLAVGEEVRVANGEGAARFGVVESVSREAAQIRLGERAPSNEATLQLTLAAAVLRPERAKVLVEKATELGVYEVLFFESERTSRPLGEGGLRRLRRVADSAVAQSGRSRVPAVDRLSSWSEVLHRVRESRSACLLDLAPRQETPLVAAQGVAETVWAPDEVPASLLLLGPEGGLTETEQCELCDAGARPLWLGPRTLRAETAAIVGCALLLGSGLD